VACGIIRLGESIPLDEPRTTHAPTLVVDQQGGRACRCGLRGCLETIASGPALKRAAADLGIESGLAGLQREAEHGHPQAGDLLRSAAAAMLIAVEKLESQFGPFVLSLGGGVIDALPQLFHTFIQSSRRARHAPRDIQSGRLADTAGAIGAARMAARALL
jgi:predicted NBD/HSP70 family sugar kinase